MIDSQKRFTIHGPGTFYSMSGFLFSGKDDPLLTRAGFGENPSVALIMWSPDPELYVDNLKGNARHATHYEKSCPTLLAAIQYILHKFPALPDECHLEVTGATDYVDWTERRVIVSVGLQFTFR